MIEGLNWTTIIVSLISASAVGIPATIIAIKTHKAVNSRMDNMLKLAQEIRETAAKDAAAVGGRRAGD